MPHKNFAPASAQGAGPREPVTFTLSGKTPTGEEWAEKFTCLEEASGVLDDLASSASYDAQGNRVFHAPSLVSFVAGVLVPEDEARFRRLTKDKTHVVPLETLGEITLWLSEELVGHPTGQ